MQGTPIFRPEVWRDSLILSDDVPTFVVNPCSIPVGITLNPPWVAQQFMCTLPGCRGTFYPTPFYGHVFLHVKEIIQSPAYEARFPGRKPPVLEPRLPDDPEWQDAYFYCHFPNCPVRKKYCWKTARERWIHYMFDHREYFNNPPPKLTQEGRLYNLFEGKSQTEAAPAPGTSQPAIQISMQNQANLHHKPEQEELPEAQADLHPEAEQQKVPPAVQSDSNPEYEPGSIAPWQGADYSRESAREPQRVLSRQVRNYRESAPEPEEVLPQQTLYNRAFASEPERAPSRQIRDYRESGPELLPGTPPPAIQASHQAQYHLSPSSAILPPFLHCSTCTTATRPGNPDPMPRGQPPPFNYFAEVIRARKLNIPIGPPPPVVEPR